MASRMELDENKRLLGVQFMRVAHDYVAPWWWGYLNEPGGEVLHNGTAFVLDCGDGPYLVTASHVYRGWLDDVHRLGPSVVAQFGNAKIEPLGELIDDSQDYDIATFRISPSQIRAGGKSPLTGIQRAWPPAPPAVGQTVFFSGCPARSATSRP